MEGAMYRSIAAGMLLLPALAGYATQKPRPQRNASVKLWLDTESGNPCEQAKPASGGWMVRNNEERNVHVIVHRTVMRGDATKQDEMRDVLGPGESRALGCEISEEGHQTLTLVKAVY
jgi:hypothetical protein